MTKHNHIPRIRVTDQERAIVEERAAAAGVSLTDYVRKVVIGGKYDGTPILGSLQDGKVLVFPGICPRCLGFGEVRGIVIVDGRLAFDDLKQCPMCQESEAA